MENNLGSRIKKAWNIFLNPNLFVNSNSGGSYSRPDRPRLRNLNERTIITSVITKLAVDVSSIDIFHCKFIHHFFIFRFIFSIEIISICCYIE